MQDNKTIVLHVIPPYVQSMYAFLRKNDRRIRSGESFTKSLQERKYPMGKVSAEEYISVSRLIHTWIEDGLIDDAVRDSKGAWKRFSLQDLLWIRIIIKLRWFGFPIDKIERVKQYLFTNINFQYGDYLFPYCVWLVLQKVPLDLIVFPNGEAHILCKPQLELDQDKIHDYISISINQTVKEVLNVPNLETDYGNLVDLSNRELSVLFLIRSGDYKTVQITLADGKIERYSATQQVETSKRIGELLNSKENPFEAINIQKADGKVVSIKRTIFKKVK